MLFDTDIVIWYEKGNKKAASWLDEAEERKISIQTYMELLQTAPSKQQHLSIKSFLNEFNFSILPLTENIGYRAAIYIEEYSLGDGIKVGDALIAATAVENNLVLVTGNAKHFKAIRDLQIKIFKN